MAEDRIAFIPWSKADLGDDNEFQKGYQHNLDNRGSTHHTRHWELVDTDTPNQPLGKVTTPVLRRLSLLTSATSCYGSVLLLKP
jgi:hypothetical protein